jgi:hypothetical protein
MRVNSSFNRVCSRCALIAVGVFRFVRRLQVPLGRFSAIECRVSSTLFCSSSLDTMCRPFV